jgi:CRP-like cAMP-binding protein
MSSSKNSKISDRLKAFDKKKNDPSSPHHPPTAPPSKLPKNKTATVTPKRVSKHCSPHTSPSTDLKTSSPMAQRQYFQKTAAEVMHMSVPEIVDRFNEQIEINERALAQEAAEKEARKNRYQQNRRKSRKNARARKKKLSNRKENGGANHYSLLPKSNAQSPTGVMLNAATSFLVDPKTYKPPTNLPKPTEPQKKLLLQALADNVLFEEKNKDSSTPPQLKDALVKAFEAVTIKKGQTVQEALTDNALYVIEQGEMQLNDENGRAVATAVAGDTIGELHTILQPQLMSGKKLEKRREMRATKDSVILRLSHADFRGIMQSTAKQGNLDKVDVLKKLPFLNKLLMARDQQTKTNSKRQDASDAVDRITSIMKTVYFEEGEVLPSDGNTLYMVKDGNVKLTSTEHKQFVLGPGNHIGRMALMGNSGNEPTVQSLQAVTPGTAYAIEKQVADKVLGQNFVQRETTRLDDAKKLAQFQCIRSANMKPATLDILAGMIEDRIHAPGTLVMEQEEMVEPCLYLVRQGQLTLSTNDGKFSHIVKAGGSFGVEQLLMPKQKSNGDTVKPTKDTRLPAQWNVRVTSQNEPCIIGVLSLIDCQEVIDNNERALPEPETAKPVVPKRQSSKHVEEQMQKIKDLVESKVKLSDLERIAVVGEGAFGEVWKVKTKLHNKEEHFALKKVTKEKEVLDALKREVIFLTKFGVHPFIVSLIKIFEDEKYRYMLMNLCEGGELWDVVHREQPDGSWTSGLGEDHAKFYAFLLADTLAFIHSKKYIYRDMKAENVLIDSDGYPILCDFGFAKYCPDKLYTACGTPNYVAPEIITSEGHNEAVDWWALGYATKSFAPPNKAIAFSFGSLT